MTENIKLKPCPCCGSDSLVLAEAGSGFIVMCEKCGTKSGKQKSPEEAAKFWNERRAFIDIFPSDSIAFMVKFYKELGKILIENKQLKKRNKILRDVLNKIGNEGEK